MEPSKVGVVKTYRDRKGTSGRMKLVEVLVEMHNWLLARFTVASEPRVSLTLSLNISSRICNSAVKP
jgi:hypothetical protein